MDWHHPSISVRRQCDLLGLSRSHLYRHLHPATESALNLELMKRLDKHYMDTPFYGRRKMTEVLRQEGYQVNPKRVGRLMKVMGIEAIVPEPNLSRPNKQHQIYPYLLSNVTIERPNHVWSTDITYCAIEGGFMYLVAVMDWYSRYVLSWALSNTLEADFCIEALNQAFISTGTTPEIFNTDQGSQFTSNDFINALKNKNIRISMDGKGRAIDNVFIERVWRSFKYECLYLREFATVPQLTQAIEAYFDFYNEKRIHQNLQYQCPHQVYHVQSATSLGGSAPKPPKYL